MTCLVVNKKQEYQLKGTEPVKNILLVTVNRWDYAFHLALLKLWRSKNNMEALEIYAVLILILKSLWAMILWVNCQVICIFNSNIALSDQICESFVLNNLKYVIECDALKSKVTGCRNLEEIKIRVGDLKRAKECLTFQDEATDELYDQYVASQDQYILKAN
ncbi:hypothetical protein ROZALSC1DRAFT_26027, partial [Rozella allomycis CSF55]